MASDIVPIELGLTDGPVYTLWAPRWRDGEDEWEAFLGLDEDLYGFSSVAELVAFARSGKPNDLDHYEGRHGIEDSAMAVREARRAGHSVFGITVDRDGKSWFPRIFGQGGFALVPHPDRLPEALPQIYRQLVGA